MSAGPTWEGVTDLIRSSELFLARGVNCSSPLLFDAALEKLSALTDKYLITYPNSGEVYDGQTQTWKPKDETAKNLVEHSQAWHQQFQVKILGGCCRTRPNDIKALYETFRGQ